MATAAVAPLAPASAVADAAMPRTSGAHARPHEPPPPSDVAVDRRAIRIATMTRALMLAAILAGFMLLVAPWRRRDRTRPLRPALPIAVPPRPD